MHLRLRFIGKALEYLNAKGYDDRRQTLQLSPEFLQVGELIRHPLFPGRCTYVVAREIDLVDRCVNVWIDELPGSAAYTDGAHEQVSMCAGKASDSPLGAGFPALQR